MGQGRAVLISSHLLAELEEICDRVAIIELGRLVAQGTVAAVKAQARAAVAASAATAAVSGASTTAAGTTVPVPQRSVRIELRLATDPPVDPATVARQIAQEPGLSAVHEEGHDSWTATFTGSASDQSRCLTRLLAAGIPIYHVAARAENLEDAFMQLTEGKVQ